MSGGFPAILDISSTTNISANTSISAGINISGATSGAYGAFTQLIASTGIDCNWMTVSITVNNVAGWTGGDVQASVEIAIGASGSEKVIVHDLIINSGGTADADTDHAHYSFPINIAAGTRVAAAVFCETEPDNCCVNITLYGGALQHQEGYAGVDSIGWSAGLGTQCTANNTANDLGAMTQLVASTSKDYAGVFIMFDLLNNQSTYNGLEHNMFNVAIGASGSEKIIIPNIAIMNFVGLNATPFFPIPIPSGTRIAAQYQNNTAATTDFLGITLYGVYA